MPPKRTWYATPWSRRYPALPFWSRPYRRGAYPGARGRCVGPPGPGRHERVPTLRARHAVLAARPGPQARRLLALGQRAGRRRQQGPGVSTPRRAPTTNRGQGGRHRSARHHQRPGLHRRRVGRLGKRYRPPSSTCNLRSAKRTWSADAKGARNAKGWVHAGRAA